MKLTNEKVFKVSNKAKNMIGNWALPNRSEERTPVTLRLDFSTYAKLHALKVIYPKRSVNEFMNDILRNGVDDVIEALGAPKSGGSEYVEEAGGIVDFDDNPAQRFQYSYQRLMEGGTKSDVLDLLKDEVTEVKS